MNDYKKSLLISIKNAYKAIYNPSYIDNKRSNIKVDEIHYAILRHVNTQLNNSDFEFFSKVTDKQEEKVKGYYFDKKTDICVRSKISNNVVATIEFKWLLSSVQKNTINSITNMIGEATNIKKNGIKTFWVYCIRKKTPVYANSGKIQSFYEIKDNFINRYKSIYGKSQESDINLPNGLCINILEDNIDTDKIETRREFEMKYNEYCQSNELEISFDTDFDLQTNGLFINNYNNFIKFICEEIGNEIKK